MVKTFLLSINFIVFEIKGDFKSSKSYWLAKPTISKSLPILDDSNVIVPRKQI